MKKTALQRLVDGPENDCERGAVEQHWCQDRGRCACMDEIVKSVSERIAGLEAEVQKLQSLLDSRDDYLVSKDLFSDYAATLNDTVGSQCG